MTILNIGSLNRDFVYTVPHIVRPGETLASQQLDIFPGGKGANQSVALARAGADVLHYGVIGDDGDDLRTALHDAGVDMRLLQTGSGPSGHAIIQVAEDGENSIVLFPGTNHALDLADLEQTIATTKPDYILLQNETNGVAEIIHLAHQQGIPLWFNPAPFTPDVKDMPIELVHTLIVNETEGASLAECPMDAEPAIIADTLRTRFPNTRIVLTLGGAGVWYQDADTQCHVTANTVSVVDTTAAGDTFIGFLLARCATGDDIRSALHYATTAAGITVSRAGAIPSIPTANEVDERLAQ